MYIIIYQKSKKKEYRRGYWPEEYLINLLDTDKDIIVISLYSNTIKIPYYVADMGEWRWTEYSLPVEVIKAVGEEYGIGKY